MFAVRNKATKRYTEVVWLFLYSLKENYKILETAESGYSTTMLAIWRGGGGVVRNIPVRKTGNGRSKGM